MPDSEYAKCLLVNRIMQTIQQIFTNFCGKVAHGPQKKQLAVWW